MARTVPRGCLCQKRRAVVFTVVAAQMPKTPSMTVQHLLMKPAKGADMKNVGHLDLRVTDGVLGGARCAPLRHLLLLESADVQAFRLHPGDLRESAVLDFPGLNALPSGTELQVGTARVRLTFHCEPCARVIGFALPSELLHRRGYLARVSASGTARVGNAVEVAGRKFEPIPYAARERLAWFLSRRLEPIGTTELLWEIGVPRSYARALPSLLRTLPALMREKVRFQRDSA